MDEFKTIFPNFDWSLLQKFEDPLHFYLEDITDDFAKKILLEKTIDKDDPLGSNSVDLVIDHIKEIYPRKAESFRSVLNRISKVKKYIHDLFQTNSNLSESSLASKKTKVVVVTHSTLIQLWTGKWEKPLSEYETIPKPAECKHLKNWQYCIDDTDYFTDIIPFHI